MAVRKADVEFYTGFLARKKEDISNLAGFPAAGKKSLVFVPAPWQEM